MTTIITHVSPDFDAIGSVWLLKRYGGMEAADVAFVNTGNPDLELLASADAVVDTGRVFNPVLLRFDHHQMPGKEANETCATSLVATHLFGDLPHYLDLLIHLIYCGDTGRPYANTSRQVGIHALLSAKKATHADDYTLLAYGFELLDGIASSLQAQEQARRTLATHTVYKSVDGLVVALKDAPQGATFAAHEAGARLVLFSSALPGPSYARGLMRGGEGIDVDAGAIVLAIVNDPSCDAAISDELSTWYRHAAGFFAGKGTAKAPCAEPMEVSIVDIAREIDLAWKREA